jgi:hypothetical protein
MLFCPLILQAFGVSKATRRWCALIVRTVKLAIGYGCAKRLAMFHSPQMEITLD